MMATEPNFGLERRRRRYLAAAAILVVAVTVWASQCFDEIVVTKGSHEGLTIGQDKAATFRAVLELQHDGRIHGFWGEDENPESFPRHYEWTAASESADMARLPLYGSWSLIGPRRILGVVRFRRGQLTHIDTYDEKGYLATHASEWFLEPATGKLREGMSPQEALLVVNEHLSLGLLASIRSTENDVAGPARLDEAAYPSLEPWDVWQLGTSDYGGFWLTFRDGRLVEIHRRLQCIELP